MSEAAPIPGIHHVTAIAGDPQANLEFYIRVLGLRLVKRTVNFDDPGVHHLYYGDATGRPGTILTFFPFPGARSGRRGTGQATGVAFEVPEGSLGAWVERLSQHGLDLDGPVLRLGAEVLGFRDPDGLALELVEDPEASDVEPWDGGPVPAEHAIRGFHSTTLTVGGYEATVGLLEAMGFAPAGEEGARFRFETAGEGPGRRVDVVCAPDALPGRVAAGSVHHVAWRAESDAVQLDWRGRIARRGLDVTPVLDRQYFRSIYFREPGGVLFEIATDPPGFTIDEPVERLGEALRLPLWYEPHRARIETALPPLRTPRPEPAR